MGETDPAPESYRAMRLRYERWMLEQKPWRLDLSTPRARLRAYWDLVFADHGVFRALYANRHRVSDRMWRSAQPGPGDIAWAARKGIKTIVNLRGARACGSYALEREAAAKRGLTLVDFSIGSREAPYRDALEEAEKLFGAIAYPALMHCKSGADRAGFMSAFYLLVHEKRPLEEAVKQLSLRFGHMKSGKTGVLDHFFEAYAEDTASAPMPLTDWVRTRYDRKKVQDSFMGTWWANVIVDRILRRE